MSIEEKLQKAGEYQQSNKLKKADILYRSILAEVPAHPVANHNLGLIALHFKRFDTALDFLNNAVSAQPQNLQFQESLFLAYIAYLEKVKKRDFASLKKRIVSFGESDIARGRLSDLDEHLKMLMREFTGSSLLAFYHAYLTVNIRRQIHTKRNIRKFFYLWKKESEFLTRHLSSKWLISACDSIIDYSHDQKEKSIAIATILFMKTIKLYESEKTMYSQIRKEGYYSNPKDVLFDKWTAYCAKGGDLVKNMIQRVNENKDPSKVSWKILLEFLSRVHQYDTVYKRFAILNEGPNKWYSNDTFIIDL